MLTAEQKQKLKDQRVLHYEAKIFELEMDVAACLAAKDDLGAQAAQRQIDQLKQALLAVQEINVEE